MLKLDRITKVKVFGSCNFESFQNITRAHKSRDSLTFIRFPVLTKSEYRSANIMCQFEIFAFWRHSLVVNNDKVQFNLKR